MNILNPEQTLPQTGIALDGENNIIGQMQKLAPWMAGSGMAMGQAFLATACSLPTVGKCVGCGSCVVGVATLCSWALKRRKTEQAMKAQGLEPFEIRTQAGQQD